MSKHNTWLAMRRRPTALVFWAIVVYALAFAVLAFDVFVWRP